MIDQTATEDFLNLTPEERAALAEDDAPPAAAAAQHDDEALELRRDVMPALTATAPADAADNLQRVAAYENEAQRQFDDGEITSAEYRDALARAADAREQVRWQQRKAELAGEMKTQAEDRQWSGAVNAFMSEHPQIANSRAALVAFDEHVKAVTSDPANARLSDRAQLEKALKLFNDDLGGAMGLRQRADAYDDMSSQGAGSVGSDRDFAALDRLASTDPQAFERAVGRLSPEQQDAYARYAG